MKKLLLFLLLIALLPGCAVNSMKNDEALNQQYAYVIGKLDSKAIEADWSNGKEGISMRGSYAVYKVSPGVYSLDGFYLGGNKYNYTVQKPAFTVLAGKINYVGNIIFSTDYTNSTYTPDAAKDFIKANYPQLAKSLDSAFVKTEVRFVASDIKK